MRTSASVRVRRTLPRVKKLISSRVSSRRVAVAVIVFVALVTVLHHRRLDAVLALPAQNHSVSEIKIFDEADSHAQSLATSKSDSSMDSNIPASLIHVPPPADTLPEDRPAPPTPSPSSKPAILERPLPPIVKPLSQHLSFTPRTAINFMHFHKTGGVSFKTSLHKFYHKKIKRSGDPVRVRDACYAREGVKDDPSRPTFLMWRCDWEPLREMSEDERNKHDFVFGHQFWGNGAGELLNKRDLRSFTVLRHPFDRKVSFYYHFFVREVGRKEEDVTFEDIRDFLLYDKLSITADLGRDLGPNYMVGRLLSDGRRGFVGNSSYSHYAVASDEESKVAEQAVGLLRNYVFVGLQKESNAAMCMLRKIVEAFNDVNGVSNEGVERIDEKAARLNSGSYSLSGDEIWKRLTEDERDTFIKKERVDVTIYAEGERLFKEHVKIFGCSDRIEDPKYEG